MAGSFPRGPLAPQKFFHPTAEFAVGAVTVTPATAALVLTTFAPTISTPVKVTPAGASLVVVTYAPTVTITTKTAHGGAFYYPEYQPRVKPKVVQPAPQPVLVSPGNARLYLRTYAPAVWISHTFIAYAPRVEVTRYITSDDILELWQRDELSTAEATALIKESRHYKWTGTQSRLLEQVSLMEAD